MKLSGNSRMKKFKERQHARYDMCCKEIGERRVFASVRPTLEWYRSVWCHQKREGTGNGISGPENFNDNFETWIFDIADRFPGHYGHFLNGMLGNAPKPLLLRTRHLLKDLAFALTICDETFNIVHLVTTNSQNRASSEKLNAKWTPEMEQAILKGEGEEEYPDLFLAQHAGHFIV